MKDAITSKESFYDYSNKRLGYTFGKFCLKLRLLSNVRKTFPLKAIEYRDLIKPLFCSFPTPFI